jgi:hypothetical protein
MELRSVEAIVTALNGAQVQYLIVGGLAVSSNGAQRLECGRVHRRCYPARSRAARESFTSILGWEMPDKTARWHFSPVGKHRASTWIAALPR